VTSFSSSLLVAVTATTEIIRGALRVRVNQSYTDALQRAGLVPLVIPPLPAALASTVLDGVAGLVLTGGEDVEPGRYGAAPHPTVESHAGRDECEIALVLAARKRALPTFAICRGAQVVNVALGGTLVRDIPSERPGGLGHDPGGARDARVHEVHADGDTTLAGLLGTERLTVNSFHHQAVDRLGEALRVSARAPDGIVEAIESTDPVWWMVGVQWHPEELIESAEAWDRQLFAAFAQMVRERAPEKLSLRSASAPRRTPAA
jgi:putative glutamine amidotransferase